MLTALGSRSQQRAHASFAPDVAEAPAVDLVERGAASCPNLASERYLLGLRRPGSAPPAPQVSGPSPAGFAPLLHLLLQEGRFEEALGRASRWVELAGQDPDAHHGLGIVLLALGFSQQADASFSRAVALAPREARYHHAAGMAQRAMSPDLSGLRALERAVDLAPENAAFLADLGRAYGETNRSFCLKAEALLAKAARLQPNSRDHRVALGCERYKQGRHAEAIADFRQALTLAPDDGWTYAMLGSACFSSQRYAEAVEAYTEAVRLGIDEPQALEEMEAARAACMAAETPPPKGLLPWLARWGLSLLS